MIHPSQLDNLPAEVGLKMLVERAIAYEVSHSYK